MAHHVHVTGVPTEQMPNGSVPIRREIRDLKLNFPYQWNLYLLGLAVLQNMDEMETLSYYQIAGIHGRPYRAWNDAADGNNGYCSHSSILFLPWHRAYLALFEQVLYGHIQKIAMLFDDNQVREAAKDFRIPYWDWAVRLPRGDSYFPSFMAEPVINVTLHTGERGEIPNPLHHFRFHPINPIPDSPDFPDDPKYPEYSWNTWERTLRHPLRENGLFTSLSQNREVIKLLEHHSSNIRDKVYNVMKLTQFEYLSNDALIDEESREFANLEDVHNQIHGYLGGGGHMGWVQYAAFDPVFWLHHANIDRLFAMWQARNPQNYITQQNEANKHGDSPLTPFRRLNANFWTPNDVRKTETLGYAYPETQSWNFATTSQLYQRSLRERVVTLYGGRLVKTYDPYVTDRLNALDERVRDLENRIALLGVAI